MPAEDKAFPSHSPVGTATNLHGAIQVLTAGFASVAGRAAPSRPAKMRSSARASGSRQPIPRSGTNAGLSWTSKESWFGCSSQPFDAGF